MLDDYIKRQLFLGVTKSVAKSYSSDTRGILVLNLKT